MLQIYRILFIAIGLIFGCLTSSLAQDDSWRDKMEFLQYVPRYFGPNAFPIPTLGTAEASTRFEIELRGEYHHYQGDKTKDLFARILLPLVKGRAGVELTWVINEDYTMTPETVEERSAVGTESPIGCHGDIVVSSYFQILKNPKWVDILVRANLKTASGNRLCDARFTDAASYWFDATFGRDLYQSADGLFRLRAQLMGGFYCWMTNDMVHRQNDAICFGGGLFASYRGFSLLTDVSGFHGYENNGDRPLVWRNKLSYELKKNVLTFRFDHGMKDRLYDSYSLAYTRCF
ncbi:MAG: hypothetical protein ACI30I_01800 [Parabacteroides sp.]